MFLLDERIRDDGSLARTHLVANGDRVTIRDDDGGAGELSLAALDRVLVRYGRPLDPEIPLTGDTVQLSPSFTLRRMRYHAPVDATGRDYLVWERPGHEPLAVIATMATAALRYLVARLSDS